MSKERLTVLLACNMDGSEKLPPLVIGKSKKPRAFKRLHANEKLPVTYNNNKTAWMTTELFVEWLKGIDRQMMLQKRQILMLLDNCPSHPHNVRLQNVKLLYLPPNATSVCQPLDQGIIQNFKLKYRGAVLRQIVNQLETNDAWKIDVLDAILLIRRAWDSVTASCITNCFRKSGFMQGTTEVEIEEIPDPGTSIPISDFASATDTTVDVTEEDYAAIDESLVTSAMPTDEDILNEEHAELPDCAEVCDSEDDEIVVEPKPISRTDYLQCLEKVKGYLLQQPNPRYDDVNFIGELEDRAFFDRESRKTQTLVTDYFKTNTTC